MKTPDIAKIVEIGLGYPEIGNAQIMDMFDVSRTTALRMKKRVRDEMIKRSVRTWNPQNINTRIAFELWGFDVSAAEQAYKRLQRLGMTEDKQRI